MNDLICLSHLRWNFVWQRPQHLMSRFAAERRVFFVEEPVRDDGGARIEAKRQPQGVVVVTPHLPHAMADHDVNPTLSRLLGHYFRSHDVADPVLWYYTPMALKFSGEWTASAVVYDCMDELSGFAGAPAELPELERALLRRADVVFTGGQSLYEAKRDLHHNIHPFPSSVDVAHFMRARTPNGQPPDQVTIPGPRLGFFGVIDERLDRDLLDAVAHARPDWHFVMIGPVVKIDPAVLPRRANIHYLGGKTYEQLPDYVSGWDVALLPFARNDATRFISPTKTPEYLAAGRVVVSTSIRDVVRPYGEERLAFIADDPDHFVRAAEQALALDVAEHRKRSDRFLASMSWDQTWARMRDHVVIVARGHAPRRVAREPAQSPSLTRAAGWQ